MNAKKVLLTGASGFLGTHTIIQLLNKGYAVTGTLRSLDRAKSIRELIGNHTDHANKLTLVEADLTDEAIWFDLMKGVDYVQHIASPFPRALPKHENDLIIPARSGTLNILKAAAENKVSRVVMTSSVASIVYGKTENELDNRLTEKDWTDETNIRDSTPYFRSKTIAEKAAWDFIRQSNTPLELTTILPGAILGPVLENDFGTSANIVIKMLDGSSPAVPKIGFDIVDVRSVADLLIRAMEMPQAANQRYIASAGYMTFKEIALTLKWHYPERKVPTAELPNILVKLFSNFDKSIKPILIDLGKRRNIENTKATKELQWQPLTAEDAVTSCAESIFALGIIR